MKKRMKKILSVVLATAAIASCAAPISTVYADDSYTIGYNNYRVGAYSLDILQKNFEYACDAMGVETMVVNDEAKIDNCPTNVDNMIAAGVNAIAFFGLNDNVMLSVAQRCENAGVYFSFYDHMPSENVLKALEGYQYYVGCAATSDISTGNVAGEYAASIDAKKAIIVTGEESDPSHSARVQGFTEAFEAAGGEVVGIGWGSPSLADALTRANDLVTAHPDADFVYGSSGDCGLAAKEAIASHSGAEANIYATDLDPDVLTSLQDGSIQAANGAHWINVYFSAALLTNALQGNIIKDAEGKAPCFVVPVMTLPNNYIDLYNKLWIESAPYSEAELAELVGADVTAEDIQAVLDEYTIDNRLAAMVEEGRVTQEEVDAVLNAAE